MEFTKYKFGLPAMEQHFWEKNISYLSDQEVDETMRKVKTDEFNGRLARLKKEKPIRSFLILKMLLVAASLLLASIILIFASHNYVIGCPALAVATLILMFGDMLNFPEYQNEIPWMRKPFSEFQEEYEKCKCTIAALADPCLGVHLEPSHLVTLMVYYHPYSRIRFLTAEDCTDVWGKTYYIDAWEKLEAVGEAQSEQKPENVGPTPSLGMETPVSKVLDAG